MFLGVVAGKKHNRYKDGLKNVAEKTFTNVTEQKFPFFVYNPIVFSFKLLIDNFTNCYFLNSCKIKGILLKSSL